MTAHPITKRLVSVVKALPRERQEQLLELAETWTTSPADGVHQLRDSTARLQASGRLDQDYLALARSELDNPPDLATVRARLARIPGSISDDCIAERDERF